MAEQFSVLGTVVLMMLVDFKKMATEFRKFFGLTSSQAFPALSIAENRLCQADGRFEFCVIADRDWTYRDSVQAYYRHSANLHEIGIKESVYERARGGDRDALVSIAHEIAHWGLINYFNLDLGADEMGGLGPVERAVLTDIHENVTDLLTALLVFSEEELMEGYREGDAGLCSCMGDGQLSLAHFYCQNHEALVRGFMKNIMPRFGAGKKSRRRKIG